MRKQTEKAVAAMGKILEGLDDYQKLCLLYTVITSECSYDRSLKGKLSRNYLGALQERSAICCGFADTMAVLVEGVTGLRAYTVIGRTGSGSSSGHAWNVVAFGDDAAYHLDATWDLGGGRHYFLRSDAQMRAEGRTWTDKYLPECAQKNTRRFYRNEEKLKALRAYFRSLPERYKTGQFSLD